jgi:hypothetical protein
MSKAADIVQFRKSCSIAAASGAGLEGCDVLLNKPQEMMKDEEKEQESSGAASLGMLAHFVCPRPGVIPWQLQKLFAGQPTSITCGYADGEGWIGGGSYSCTTANVPEPSVPIFIPMTMFWTPARPCPIRMCRLKISPPCTAERQREAFQQAAGLPAPKHITPQT